MMSRTATIERHTKETQIQLTLHVDDPSRIQIDTPLPFFSHMLNAFACHGRFGLEVQAQGDIEVDPHHLIEDTGIVLGQAIKQALNGYKGIQRAGCFAFPMDGTLAVVALDLCGRPNLVWNVQLGHFTLGGLDPNLFKEFYKGLVDGMMATVHVHIPCRDNDHHVIEAIFKAFGRALKDSSVILDENVVLSTKGMIET
jgi:imidazoleglycerol-phosphate dehydratase